MTYKIIRKFFDNRFPDELIEEGLTLKQAQEHCSDPETCSDTATGREAVELTARCGKWFDVFYREEE